MIHRNRKDEVKNALNAIRYLARVEEKISIYESELKGCVALDKLIPKNQRYTSLT
jgi:hypothetical protein